MVQTHQRGQASRRPCGPIAGAAEKGVLGELEWRPSLSRGGVSPPRDIAGLGAAQ
jgi:hypothetical protein